MSQFKVLEARELPLGSKRVVKLGETDILLIHCETGIFAVQSKCPHAGGPLQEGAVCNGRLICPWHMGTFALPAGELLEPPAMEPLKSYPVQVRNEGIFVEDVQNAAEPESALPVGGDKLFLIVGAGAAGTMAAATLRQRHYTGRIVMVDPWLIR